MSWEALFQITNLLALVGWVVLAALPRNRVTHGLVLLVCVGLLSAIYTAVFAGLVTGLLDPVGSPGSGGIQSYSVEGLMAMFASKGAIVVGWTHYLAFDLFVGLWIAKDADQRRVGRLVQLPFLMATFLAGPIGLLAWLIVRSFRDRVSSGKRADSDKP